MQKKILFFVLLLLPYFMNAQVLSGGDIVGGGSQIWNFVDNNEKYPHLSGTLLDWHINKGFSLLHDWDLCIFIYPTSSNMKYSFNSKHKQNKKREGHRRGNIELEVAVLQGGLHDRPKDNFSSFFGQIFNRNQIVEVYGFWVQDWGHDPLSPKTEIHPLIMKQVYLLLKILA